MLGAVAAIRLGIAAVIYRRVIRSKQWLKWLALIPVKDILSFGIWGWSFFSSTVTWRGRSYKILRDGRIIEEA
jgi:ceramide glucosyltransferase